MKLCPRHRQFKEELRNGYSFESWQQSGRFEGSGFTKVTEKCTVTGRCENFPQTSFEVKNTFTATSKMALNHFRPNVRSQSKILIFFSKLTIKSLVTFLLSAKPLQGKWCKKGKESLHQYRKPFSIENTESRESFEKQSKQVRANTFVWRSPRQERNPYALPHNKQTAQCNNRKFCDKITKIGCLKQRSDLGCQNYKSTSTGTVTYFVVLPNFAYRKFKAHNLCPENSLKKKRLALKSFYFVRVGKTYAIFWNTDTIKKFVVGLC